MRGPVEPDQELVMKYKSTRFIKKHPNKHHEGDRKRWRDQITELERKRYEGVWATNKGILTSTYQIGASLSIDASNGVLNIVARDIWSRSRLPSDVLEETWELVDSSRTGLLSKEEFVVGMWLVDQGLKGRKLPVKVSNSVWYSARGLTGIHDASGQHKATVSGDDGKLVLQQDQLNGTGNIIECTQNPLWFRSWSDHMHAKYYESACISAWQEMIALELVPHGTEKFEFLSEGTPSSSPEYRPMRTPRRYTRGTLLQPV
ncbi:MAG: hypothetical protein Q9170_002497 [Blastenia crenularia]